MSENLSIPSSTRSVYAAAPTRVQPAQDIYLAKGSSYGPLTSKDKALLEDFCGYDFVWPPEPGLPFPREAAFVAEMRDLQGNLSDTDLFGQLSKYQQTRLRMSGDTAFSDEFLAFVASKSVTPAAASFLANGGKSSLYA